MTPEERKAEWHRTPSQEEIDRAIEASRRPALLLNKTKFPHDPGEPGCWLGGEPTLPPRYEWPHNIVKGVNSPLYFVAQIDLSCVPGSIAFPKMPKVGTLFFFYDPVFLTFDGHVIYAEEDVSKYPPRRMPNLPGPESFEEDPSIHGLSEVPTFKKWNIDFVDFDTFLPDLFQNRILQQHISGAQQTAINTAGEETKERWSGAEAGSSQEMSLSYLFGSQTELRAPKGENVLLLKIDQDKDVGIWDPVFWYFWIPAEALKVRDFGQVFMTNE